MFPPSAQLVGVPVPEIHFGSFPVGSLSSGPVRTRRLWAYMVDEEMTGCSSASLGVGRVGLASTAASRDAAHRGATGGDRRAAASMSGSAAPVAPVTATPGPLRAGASKVAGPAVPLLSAGGGTAIAAAGAVADGGSPWGTTAGGSCVQPGEVSTLTGFCGGSS